MSKFEKLLASIRNNLKAVHFDDLDKVMRRYGFTVEHAGGSHLVYRKDLKEITVVRPHGGRNEVKPVYVRLCLAAIEGEDLDGDQG